MQKLQNNPVRLQKKISGFEKLRGKRPLTGEELEALVEAQFRLSVHPQTSPSESIKLLQKSIKIDGTNPKFAYHLARLFFIHNEMDTAAEWLRYAASLCPTSHRIWSHVYLLQMELNIRYNQDAQYKTDSLKNRYDSIKKLIKLGKDNIDASLLNFEAEKKLKKSSTPKSNQVSNNDPGQTDKNKQQQIPQSAEITERQINPGVCRWVGITDLEAEYLLNGKVRKKTLNKLHPLLEEAKRNYRKRPERLAGFVILMIQWIISGYPVQTVRQLSEKWPQFKRNPAFDLLDLVCDIVEAEEDTVPNLIKQALESEKMPVYLAACIHKMKLLWRPLSFDAFVAHRTARNFLRIYSSRNIKEGNQRQKLIEEVAQHVTSLKKGLDSFNPPRPKQIEDVSFKPEKNIELTESQAMIFFSQLEGNAKQLKDLFLESFRYLKDDLLVSSTKITDKNLLSQVVADANAVKKISDELRHHSQSGSNLLNTFLKHIKNLDAKALGDTFENRKKTCQNYFTDIKLKKYKRPMQKIQVAIQNAAENFKAEACAPSEKPTAIEKRLAEISFPDISPQKSHVIDEKTAIVQEDFQRTFSQLENEAQLLKDLYLKILTFIKNDLLSNCGNLTDEKLFSQVVCDVEAINGIIIKLKGLARSGPKRLGFFLSDIKNMDPGEFGADFENRKRRCENCFTDVKIKKVKSSLTKVEAAIQNVSDDFKAAPSKPSKKVTEILSSLDEFTLIEADNEASQSKANLTEKEDLTEGISGIEGLACAIANVEKKIENRYTEALNSFAMYPSRVKNTTPFKTLQKGILESQAETFYRLGRPKYARRVWNIILTEDRLNLAALKNIALCDTREADISRSLNSWKSYIEILYYYDIVSGNPTLFASQRAHFHLNFANAYAPSLLVEEKLPNREFDELEQLDFVAFFNSPARFRHFIEHMLLCILNTKLCFNSPSLLLGIERAESRKVRDQAKDKMNDFIEYGCQFLPERIRDAFRLICKKHIEKNFEEINKVEDLTLKRDPYYDHEHSQQFKWIGDLITLRYKLFLMINSDEFSKRISSVAFLDYLKHLAKIPFDLSPNILRAEALKKSPSAPDKLLETIKDTEKLAIQRLLEFAVDLEEDESKRSLQDRQYQRLINSWVKHPAFNEYLDKIDDPQFSYSKAIIFTLQNKARKKDLNDEQKELFEQGKRELHKWCKLRKGITGPALHLSVLLFEEGNIKGAIDLLENAIENGFYDEGIRKCEELLNQIKLHSFYESGKFDQAISHIRQAMQTEKEEGKVLQMWTTLAQAYHQLIKKDPQNAPLLLEDIYKDFNDWLKRVKDIKDKTTKDKAKDDLHNLMIAAAVGPLGKIGENENWPEVDKIMKKVLSIDPRNMEAVYLQMVSKSQIINKVIQSDKNRARKLLVEASQLANQYIKHGKDPEKLKTARQIQEHASII